MFKTAERRIYNTMQREGGRETLGRVGGIEDKG